jgi:hypothetical protein
MEKVRTALFCLTKVEKWPWHFITADMQASVNSL